MAHDKDKDHSHAENPGAGTDGSTPESAENSTAAIGAEQSKTKGKVRGVLGRLWDGVKLFAEKVGYVTGALEHPDDRAEGNSEEPHEKEHEKKHEKPHAEKPNAEKPNDEAPKADDPKPTEPDNDDEKTDSEGETGPEHTSEVSAGTDNDERAPEVPEGTEAPSTAEDSNGPDEPAPAPAPAPVPAPVTTPAEVTPPEAEAPKVESPKKDEKEEPPHDKKHGDKDAHGAHAKEGMGNGTKAALIATGIAGATVVASTALAAKATAEVADSVFKHGPKWLQTVGDTILWTPRAIGRFVEPVVSETLGSAKDGFMEGREELVGHADYEELTGWTAPLKLAHNGWKSIWQNPVTRFIGGVTGGALGLAGGFLTGISKGTKSAFKKQGSHSLDEPEESAEVQKAKKPKKEKKPKKVKADAHGHGADSHGHGHAKDEHKDPHAKPEAGHGDAHKDKHKDEHAKPAEAGHGDDAHKDEHAAHHRLAA